MQALVFDNWYLGLDIWESWVPKPGTQHSAFETGRRCINMLELTCVIAIQIWQNPWTPTLWTARDSWLWVQGLEDIQEMGSLYWVCTDTGCRSVSGSMLMSVSSLRQCYPGVTGGGLSARLLTSLVIVLSHRHLSFAHCLHTIPQVISHATLRCKTYTPGRCG
jgi:hypothetical protein